MTDGFIPVHHGNCIDWWYELQAEAVRSGLRLPGWAGTGLAFDHRVHHARLVALRVLIDAARDLQLKDFRD